MGDRQNGILPRMWENMLSKLAIILNALLCTFGGIMYASSLTTVMTDFAPTVFPKAPPEVQRLVIQKAKILAAHLLLMGTLQALALFYGELRIAHASGLVWGTSILSVVYSLHSSQDISDDIRTTAVAQSMEESKAIGFITMLHLLALARLSSQTVQPETSLVSCIALLLSAWTLCRKGAAFLRDHKGELLAPRIASAASVEGQTLLSMCVRFVGCYYCAVGSLMLASLWFGTVQVAHRIGFMWAVTVLGLIYYEGSVRKSSMPAGISDGAVALWATCFVNLAALYIL